ncbi:MAG: DUF4382 domain-containing protein [Gemmatimonadota bacterium]
MLRRTPLLLLGLLALGACDSTSPDGNASVSVLLTDLPGDVSQAVVMIEDIQLVGGGGPALSLMSEPWVGDLTELENAFAALVEDEVVPKGTYGQLRLIIPEACIGVETEGGPDEVYVSDGATTVECDGTPAGTLQMPSLAETGIKVVFQGALDVLSDQKILLIDFNVAESFGRLAGMSGMWVMDPVIHGADLTFTGSLTLTVEMDDGVSLPGGVAFEDFEATLNGDGVFLVTDGDVGTATFLYVIPGTYDLDIVPPGSVTTFETDPTLPVNLTVGSQEEKAVTVTVTEIG